jgi:flagellar basal-body rod protein FlgG
MLEGMYTAAAGMAAQQDRMDAVSNDLANADTTGYKQVRVGFRDLLYGAGGPGAGAGVQIGVGAAATDMGRNESEGNLQSTGQPLDVALQGPGFLSVRDLNGKPAMTRDGSLRINDAGRLTNEQGMLINPPITVPKGTQPSQVSIGPDGSVTVAGKSIGALKLVNVRAPNALSGGDGNVFYATKASGPATAADKATTVQTGVLESSNVDLGQAMVDMIEAQRSYELASKAINVQDEMMQTANAVKK